MRAAQHRKRRKIVEVLLQHSDRVAAQSECCQDTGTPHIPPSLPAYQPTLQPGRALSRVWSASRRRQDRTDGDWLGRPPGDPNLALRARTGVP